MATEIVNAKITATTLGREDHGIPSSFIRLAWDGYGQGFGGYNLCGKAMEIWVSGILDALQLGDWSKLPNTYCRIEREAGWNGKIIAIGHIVEDSWFFASSLTES